MYYGVNLINYTYESFVVDIFHFSNISHKINGISLDYFHIQAYNFHIFSRDREPSRAYSLKII